MSLPISMRNPERSYHDKHASWYAARRTQDFIWEVPEEIFLLRKKYFQPGSTVVDMGCGPAVSVRNILSRELLLSLTYIGVDISKEMLKYAKRNIPSARCINEDISSVSLTPKSADVIISLGALHHALDKNKTLRHWVSILKPGGFLLLREPTYEALRRGEGESPLEEGVNVSAFLSSSKENNMRVVSFISFSSPVFHLFNRVMIKIGLGSWQKIRWFWYPVVYMDAFLSNYFGNLFPFMRGLAFAAVLQKKI